MINVDFSDLERVISLYNDRLSSMRTNPFGDNRGRMKAVFRKFFRETALATSENINMHHLENYWRLTGKGKYGGRAPQPGIPEKVNLQEFISSPGALTKVRGTGHLVRDSAVIDMVGESGIVFNLVTMAEMQPYPEDEFGNYKLPKRPIMLYMRQGWVEPDSDNPKRMVPRPFADKIASLFAGSGASSRFPDFLLSGANFRKKV